MTLRKAQSQIFIVVIAAAVLIVGMASFYPTSITIEQEIFESQDQLKKFSSVDEIKTFLESNAESSILYSNSMDIRTFGAMAESADMGFSTTKGAAPTSQGGTDDFSTTNIQVEGVDEADIVKNDGKYIYVLSGKTISIVDAYPPENTKIMSTINITGNPQELYVDGDRLIVLGNDYIYQDNPKTFEDDEEPGISEDIMAEKMMIYPPITRQIAFAEVYDISDRENPKQTRNVTVDGYYFDSRMIGDEVYVIATQYTYYYRNDITTPMITYSGKEISPDIYYFDIPDNSYTFTTIMSINAQDDEKDIESKIYLLGSSRNMYVSKENIYITYQRRVRNTYYMDMMFDDVIIPLVPKDIAEQLEDIKESNASYWEKQNRMGDILQEYGETLTEAQKKELEIQVANKTEEMILKIAKETDRTVIHKINIKDGKINYKNSGEVPGTPLNQFSMDEHNGYFRIATTTRVGGGGIIGSPIRMTTSIMTTTEIIAAPEQQQVFADSKTEPEEKTESIAITQKSAPITSIAMPRPSIPTTINNLYILDEELNIVGKVEDLAPGESIYSARFMGDKAYIVTFKRVDPLFVIDLEDPNNPKVTGKLKIPGYSDYLHPYDENHIIGIGKEVTGSETDDFTWHRGVKLAIFDVSDIENPIELSKFEIGDRGTDSYALHEHKAFLFDREKNLLVIPILLAEIDRSKYDGDIPDWAYGEYKWQGAYIFSIDTDNGIRLKGRITHAEDDENIEKGGWFYYGSKYSVKRSLYMGDYLYTVSDSMIKMNDLDNLDEINKIEIEGRDDEYPYRIY